MQWLIREARARKLDRVAGVYILACWGLIPGAAILLPTFYAPDWVLRDFISVLILGFPVALAVAWKRAAKVIALPEIILSTDADTQEVMTLAHESSDLSIGIAVDGCFEIIPSYRYLGWKADDFEFELLEQAREIPPDLSVLIRDEQPKGPNNPKWQLAGLIPDSFERDRVSVTLVPTTYFRTIPIKSNLRKPVVKCGVEPCSPLQKYGPGLLLQFGKCSLPSQIVCHIIVVLEKRTLLLCQRTKHEGVDWEPGKWSCSIEEDMSGPPNNGSTSGLPVDDTFFAVVERGMREELLGMDASIPKNQVQFLSLNFESNISVLPFALVNLNMDLNAIRERAEHSVARDSRAELRKFAEIEFTPTAIAPALCRRELIVPGATIYPSEWHRTSRMRMLTALYHRWGVNHTNLKLKASMG